MYPIVLAHGIARFDILRQTLQMELNIPENPLDDELQYFRNIRTYLQSNGFPKVFNTNVDFAGELNKRSRDLKQKVEKVLEGSGTDKVHIIAHSMGGLDARRMIVDLKMEDKVASLTTIGTPHLGTVLADYILENGGEWLIEVVDQAIKLDLLGFRDLTTKECGVFNDRAEELEAKNKVVYQTFSSFERGRDVFFPLLLSWKFINSQEGQNDGLVSVKSQSWKNELNAPDGTKKQVIQHQFPVPADHLNQVGWWDWEELVLPWFGGSIQNQRNTYETKIKNIYLEIAKGLQNLEQQN